MKPSRGETCIGRTLTRMEESSEVNMREDSAGWCDHCLVICSALFGDETHLRQDQTIAEAWERFPCQGEKTAV